MYLVQVLYMFTARETQICHLLQFPFRQPGGFHPQLHISTIKFESLAMGAYAMLFFKSSSSNSNLQPGLKRPRPGSS